MSNDSQSKVVVINYSDILVSPFYSEKAVNNTEKHNQYSFIVKPYTNKLTIKHAVEKLYNVSVVSVRTVNIKGKVKTFRGRVGKQSAMKKAYITLAEGNKIEMIGKE